MDRRTTRCTIALCGLLSLLTLAVFHSVVKDDFVEYDDQIYVSENTAVQSGLSWDGVRWAFGAGGAHAGNWIPLTWLSHMLVCQLFGLQPGWHHFTNLLFHTANAVGLFLLLKRTTRAMWPSWLVAALFALHPLHVESVAWVSERKDVLSTFFFMLALWSYSWFAAQRSAEADSPKSAGEPGSYEMKAGWFYMLALVWFALGLMSKPMLVTLPFVLLLWDCWPLGRFAAKKKGSNGEILLCLLREKIPFLVVSLVFSIVTFVVQRQAGAMLLTETVPLKLRLANTAVSYGRYLLKTIWPLDLAAFYPFPLGWDGWQVALSVLVLLLGTLAALRSMSKYPYIAVGWFWYIGTLVPVIGIIQVGTQSMADRYSYIPLIGIFMIMAFGMRDLARGQPEWQQGLNLFTAVVVALCVLASAAQAGYWSNTATLFEHALAVTSNNALAEYEVGVAQTRKTNYAEAYQHFIEALRIKPDYGIAHNNLGLLLVMNGKVDEGIAHYRQALQCGTESAEVHLNLASALITQGELEEAAVQCRAALATKPSFCEARLKLAMILEKQGKIPEAIGEYQSALALAPANADAHFGLGLMLLRCSRPKEAVTYLQQAVRLRPDAQMHYSLALCLALEGNPDEALAQYREAVRLEPSWPRALNDLAWVLATDPNPKHRDGDEAVKLAEKACSLTQRKDPRYLGTLDACYAEQGRFELAIATANEAQTLALASGEKEIADAAAERRKLYELKQPYRQGGASK